MRSAYCGKSLETTHLRVSILSLLRWTFSPSNLRPNSVGATLLNSKYEILILVIFLMCVVLGPLLVFTPQLVACKLAGLREYGTLAERYVREFDAKWLRGGAPTDEPLVGSGDIQSLADLGNSFEVVRTMRIAPFTKETILQLAVATIAPVARYYSR